MPHRFSRLYFSDGCVAAILAGTIWLAHCAAPSLAGDADAFHLTTGDRVVSIGAALVERDAAFGYLETALSTRFHDQDVQFRNLGRAGDNVLGEARADVSGRDGLANLKRQVLAIQPTVIFLNYGANESFAGLDGLESFKTGLESLLEMLDVTKARIVIMTPTPHENFGPPLPDPAQHNKDVRSYSLAIAAIAKRRDARLVNLHEIFSKLSNPAAGSPATDDGIHLTAYGYWCAAPAIEQALGLPPRRWQIEIDARRQNISARGTQISEARFTPGQIAFAAIDEQLPLAPLPPGSPEKSGRTVERVVRIFGLAPGAYALSIDGQEVARATAGAWTSGVSIVSGADFDQAEKLRGAIVAKNRVTLNQPRSDSEALVNAQEATIRELRSPALRKYELVSVDAR